MKGGATQGSQSHRTNMMKPCLGEDAWDIVTKEEGARKEGKGE